VHGRTVDHIRDSFLIHKSECVMFGAGQATGNRTVLVVSYGLAIDIFRCARLAALTKSQS